VAGLRTGLQGFSEWLQRRVTWWLGAISSFFVYDIMRDIGGGEIDAHVLIEAVIFAICTVLLVAELRRNRRLRGRLEEVQARNRRLSGDFSGYVGARLEGWGLSRSEQEIAWLTLKGYSFTEIASLRSVQEKTVRQQATSIYAKSGCRNRNEFIAHFIEDLLAGEHPAAARAE
jgi:DNA-binding CsgD family transcriptional regulator